VTLKGGLLRTKKHRVDSAMKVAKVLRNDLKSFLSDCNCKSGGPVFSYDGVDTTVCETRTVSLRRAGDAEWIHRNYYLIYRSDMLVPSLHFDTLDELKEHIVKEWSGKLVRCSK